MVWALALFLLPACLNAQALGGTELLTAEGDLAEQMVEGIGRFLTREIGASTARRQALWQRDFSSPRAYRSSVAGNRQRLRRIIGLVDTRLPFQGFALDASTIQSSLAASTDTYEIHAVRWPVLKGVQGEGLLLEPRAPARANIVALPDADWSPEMLVGLSPGVPAEAQFARRLAEAGCRVLVPVLINRRDDWSGHPRIRYTNQPHREFIYRMAYEMGRHIIGYEVQKVLAAVDWFEKDEPGAPVGVMGYGEGGLLALYSGAADERIDVTAVSGYFGPRLGLWREPIYRNVWALLHEFGDAELAGLIAPRALLVEAAAAPEVDGPPPPAPQRRGAAPGRITTPAVSDVRAEVDRAKAVFEKLGAGERLKLLISGEGRGQPGAEATLSAFLLALRPGLELPPPGRAPSERRKTFRPELRLRRQFEELVEFTQHIVRQSEFTRREFWARADASSIAQWEKNAAWYRDYFWDEVIGRLPDPSEPLRPRSRQIFDRPNWKGYEVVLPVWRDVFAYGILLVPKDLQPGERRPVVVCQHGLEGRPRMVVDSGIKSPYHHYGARLADRGFIVFAPQNPYIGGDSFRVLQRKANPIKRSLFSFILGQHQRIFEWLSALPFADRERIAFYGLSYGGKTAVRVPPLLKEYALSICSADFNEWIWKNTSTEHRYSYLYTIEYEMFEFNLGNTFNYGDLAALMAPRPFMVERGHHDGVAPDEWVAYEFAKVRRHYAQLGLADRARIEFFNGPHEIYGVGTFEFLRQHLRWPD